MEGPWINRSVTAFHPDTRILHHPPTPQEHKSRGICPTETFPPDAGSSPTPMKKQKILQPRRTNPLAWFAAVVCAILAVVVIITGVVVLSVYLAYRPKMPYIRVRDTHLDAISFDTLGQLGVRITIIMEADNDNTKADASFSDIGFELQFAQVPLAYLQADPFDVARNSSLPLPYVVESSTVSLDPPRMDKMDRALKQGKVEFSLRGQARTRWRVGVFLSVRFWTHLDCNLQYFYPNGSSIDLDCTSKSH